MLQSTRFSLLIAISTGFAIAQNSSQPTGPAVLAVTGHVPTPLSLKAEDLASMPREKVMIAEQDGSQIEYEGVPLVEIRKKAGAPLGGQLRGAVGLGATGESHRGAR